MIKSSVLTIFLVMLTMFSRGQDNSEMVWYDVAKIHINGKISNAGTAPFERLPKNIQYQVREKVWGLSQNPSGLYIRFYTTATSMAVRYQTEGELGFPHMPPTGVSGVDLYAKDDESEWHWIRGNYSFKDTISYNFTGIKTKERPNLREYYLYFPLYAKVKWMEIGVPIKASFEAIGNSQDVKPIIVYGTSIAQGACASRSGMAWTSILGRQMDKPVINLGFSGNGRLEPEIINYITQSEASCYVLDCMPNFTSGQGLNPMEAKKRLMTAVQDIRKKRPKTPILIVEHAGYSDGSIQLDRLKAYTDLNKATEEIYSHLIEIVGIKSIYLLKKNSIGLDIDSFVDGTHPNDHGMLQYADAYQKKIKEIESEN